MTGVVEFAAAAAAVAAYAHSTSERHAREESAGRDLYRRHFKADLLEQSTGEVTALGAALPAELHPQAASCIKAIEAYQQRRRTWFLGFSRSDVAGDIRSRILEEMKQWLVTLSGEGADAAGVALRLDYCSQFLLRPSVFHSTNDQSFLGTMAQVCSQLEGLLRQAVAGQRTGAERLGRVLGHGRELAEALLPVLLLTLPSEAAVPLRARAALAPGGPAPLGGSLGLAAVRAAAAAEAPPAAAGAGASGAARGPLVDRGTDAGRVLWSLLGTEHFLGLGAGEGRDEGPPGRAAPAAGAAPEALPQVLQEAKARWAQGAVAAESGLSVAFRGPAQQGARAAFLDLCQHLDRVAFFCAALRPHQSLAGMAGDIAMCWLRESLGHLLQELEKALLQLRQSRLEVMRAVRLQLQELAKRSPGARTEDFRWMQGLRHIDEVHLDGLHRATVRLCADIRLATTTARELELSAATRRQLADMTAAFASADFQSRCAPALRDRLAVDMRELSRLADSADPTHGGRPQAIEVGSRPP